MGHLNPIDGDCSSERFYESKQYRREIVWRNVVVYVYLHAAGIYGVYLMVSLQCDWRTVVWCHLYGYTSALGITAGAHRLWSHRTYKAKLPLRILLAILNSICIQNTIYDWVRDHRAHHKFTETDADPHNSKRGFFFAHAGWLLLRKHPDVKSKRNVINVGDLESDPVVMFQRKYYTVVASLLGIFLPIWVAWYFWNETLWSSYHVPFVYRYMISLNSTWLVNSAAHVWGMKPYDKYIAPTENLAVAVLAIGEGWHNYHHVFPWDYKTSELGNYGTNITTAFIDLMARIGWAYDLRSARHETIMQRIKRTGDGS